MARRDIDDVLQDVLLAAHRGFHSFDPTRHVRTFEDQSDKRAGVRAQLEELKPQHEYNPLCAWLYGIAWRQVSHYRDRAYRRREVTAGLYLRSVHQQVEPRPDPEQHMADGERAALVSAVLARMDLQLRVVLVLHDMVGARIQDIAGELGVNRNTVQNRLRLAREDFRAAVKRMNDEQRQALWPRGTTRKARKARSRSPRRRGP